MATRQQINRDPLVYGIIGFLLGGIIFWFMATSVMANTAPGMMGMRSYQNGSTGMMQMHDADDMHGGMTMDDMVNNLQGKTGDAFDEAFLSEMIEHHQGAIDMAKEAEQNAKHEELKSMARDIISAQSKEIEQMKQWQKDWGY